MNTRTAHAKAAWSNEALSTGRDGAGHSGLRHNDWSWCVAVEAGGLEGRSDRGGCCGAGQAANHPSNAPLSKGPATVDIGWSRQPANPDWSGGAVSGIIGSDPESLIRLVSETPMAEGLVASAPPSTADIPNNHRGYALQWFSFAAIAGVIFSLALWRRMRA